MALATIENTSTGEVKIIYNDVQPNEFEDYIKRSDVVRVRKINNNSIPAVEIIRIHLTDGEYVDAHFSTIDSIKCLADPSPVSIPDNETLLSKLLELWRE